MIGGKIEIRKVCGVLVLESGKPLKECLKVAHKLWIGYDSGMENIIRRVLMRAKGLWIHPLYWQRFFT